MVILCDMDGVVANFVDTVLYAYNKDFKDSLTADDITSYGMHKVVKPECGDRIYEYYHAQGTFAKCPVIEGSQSALQTFKEMGHDVYFVTKPVDHSLYCMLEKQQWVEKHFPNIGYKKMIFTEQKHMVRGDVLIDDHVDNLFNFPGHRILVDSPWNRHIDSVAHNMTRLKTWDGIITYIANIR